MAIIPSQKNALALLRQFRDEIETRTAVTNFNRDSKIRALADVFTDESLQDREDMTQAFYANQISNAKGTDLENIGERLGRPKKVATFGKIHKSEQSLAFYVDSGTFGDINGAADIALTLGVIVSSNPNSNELGADISYKTTETYTLPAASNIFFCSAEALVIGDRSVVGAEVLSLHNFTGYTGAASGGLKVINFYPVLDGRNTETDQSYRSRLTNTYASLAQVNEARVKLEGLKVPGVLQTRVLPAYYGIGTAGVAVMGPEFQTNVKLVAGVQNHLSEVGGPGMLLVATSAIQVTFDFELEISTRRATTEADKTLLEAEIKRTMLDYFRVLPMGTTVNGVDLATRIQTGTNGIVSMGTVGGKSVFKAVWIRKGLPGSTTDDRQKLLDNTYTLNAESFGALGTITYSYL